jgi:plasmid stability protein
VPFSSGIGFATDPAPPGAIPVVAADLDVGSLAWVEVMICGPKDPLPGLTKEHGSCDTVSVKNITVTIEDELHRRARVRAAELDTSLSAVVREFLTRFAEGETDFERRKRLQEQALASVKSFRAGTRMSREAVHRRNALR